MQPFLKSHTRTGILAPGRCIVFQHWPKFTTRFGIILDTYPQRSHDPQRFTLLTLTSSLDDVSLKEKGLQVSDCEYAELMEAPNAVTALDQMFMRFLYLAHSSTINFTPLIEKFGHCDHCIIDVEYAEIVEITSTCFRVEPGVIINDVKRRQIERFRYYFFSQVHY